MSPIPRRVRGGTPARRRMRRSWTRATAAPLAILAAVVLAVGACSSSVSGTPAADQGAAGMAETSTTRSSGTTSTANSTAASTDDTRTTVTDPTEFASGVTLEEFESDLKDAQTIVDEYWATHWSDFYTGTLRAADRRSACTTARTRSTAPTCDGEPLEAYNAFYCPHEDYVAWDVEPAGRRRRPDRRHLDLPGHRARVGHAIQTPARPRPGRGRRGTAGRLPRGGRPVRRRRRRYPGPRGGRREGDGQLAEPARRRDGLDDDDDHGDPFQRVRVVHPRPQRRRHRLPRAAGRLHVEPRPGPAPTRSG